MDSIEFFTKLDVQWINRVVSVSNLIPEIQVFDWSKLLKILLHIFIQIYNEIKTIQKFLKNISYLDISDLLIWHRSLRVRMHEYQNRHQFEAHPRFHNRVKRIQDNKLAGMRSEQIRTDQIPYGIVWTNKYRDYQDCLTEGFITSQCRIRLLDSSNIIVLSTINRYLQLVCTDSVFFERNECILVKDRK